MSTAAARPAKAGPFPHEGRLSLMRGGQVGRNRDHCEHHPGSIVLECLMPRIAEPRKLAHEPAQTPVPIDALVAEYLIHNAGGVAKEIRRPADEHDSRRRSQKYRSAPNPRPKPVRGSVYNKSVARVEGQPPSAGPSTILRARIPCTASRSTSPTPSPRDSPPAPRARRATPSTAATRSPRPSPASTASSRSPRRPTGPTSRS